MTNLAGSVKFKTIRLQQKLSYKCLCFVTLVDTSSVIYKDIKIEIFTSNVMLLSKYCQCLLLFQFYCRVLERRV